MPQNYNLKQTKKLVKKIQKKKRKPMLRFKEVILNLFMFPVYFSTTI